MYGCATAAVLAAALYLNSINGEFVFDDHEAIETNVDVRYKASRLDLAHALAVLCSALSSSLCREANTLVHPNTSPSPFFQLDNIHKHADNCMASHKKQL